VDRPFHVGHVAPPDSRIVSGLQNRPAAKANT
jgi:hypothetical protein